MPIETVAIIGAGIAGLTAALAFAQRGIACDIFEEAPALAEVGAGLQISPNASSILARLGLLPALESAWTEPERIELVSGTDLRPLAHVPAGAIARHRWGAPYGVLHRSTLQQVLLRAVRDSQLCKLHLGAKIDDADPPSLKLVSGRLPQLVVGADGVWSKTRCRIQTPPVANFSRNVAWRFTIPRAAAPVFLKGDAVTAFLGPASHVVAYPLKEVNGFNVVAIASGINPGKTWEMEATESQKRLLLQQFARWSKAIIDMLEAAPRATCWPLFDVSPGRWQNGRDTVLIGDAAHAMMPFAAQGAAMAIEDAFALAAKLASPLPLATTLSAFETERAARVARVRARGAFNRFAYHARGPVRLGRDLVLSLRSPQSLAADFDWLYGYRLPE
jgi:salicylate hydroxylase